MKNFKFSILFLALLTVLMLAACSSDSGSSSNEESSDSGDSTVATSGSTSKDAKVLKIAFTAAEEAMKPLYMIEQEIESKTNGSIDVQFYPSGQLGGDVQALEGLRTGTIEASAMSTTIVASLEPKFNIYDVPFLFESSEQAYGIMDGEIGQELLSGLEQYDVVGLVYLDGSYRNLTNNVKEIKTPDDLKGLNIRTLENELQVKFWKELGANPTAISFDELYTALESNVVEGQENPFNVIESSKLYEVQDYITQTEHLLMPRALLLSKKFWDSLTEEEQTIVREAAKVTSESFRSQTQELQQAAIDKIKSSGVTITELTPEERQLWVDKAAPVYEEFKAKIGEDLFNKVMESVQ